MNMISVKGFGANMSRDTARAQILLGLMMMLPKYSLMLNQWNAALRALGKIIDQHQQKA